MPPPLQTVSAPRSLQKYLCIRTFNPQGPREISIKIGQIVELISKDQSGWWLVYSYERQGYVPGSYLVPMDCDHGPGGLLSSGKMFITSQPYKARQKDELSLPKNQLVELIEENVDGWWTVKIHGVPKDRVVQGLFPATYLRPTNKRQIKEQKIKKSESSDVFYAIEDYEDTYGDSISLKKGDYVKVIEKRTGWWYGEVNGLRGWVPSTYLSELKTDTKTKSRPISHSRNNKDIDSGLSSQSSLSSATSTMGKSIELLNNPEFSIAASQALDNFNLSLVEHLKKDHNEQVYNFELDSRHLNKIVRK